MQRMNFEELLAMPNMPQTEPKPPIRWQCPDHGEYGEDAFRMVRTCPDCAQEAQARTNEFYAAHGCYRWWRDDSGIPARYRCALPELIATTTSNGKALRKAVAAYAEAAHERAGAGQGLTLLGAPGTGKTLALCALVNVWSQSKQGAVYASWPDVIAGIKGTFGSRNAGDAINELASVPLLALDELGLKSSGDWEHGELFRLIDTRYSAQLPTLTASNATRETFPALVGERVADRLAETNAQLVLAGESQRGKLTVEGPDALQPPPRTLTLRTHESGQRREREIEAPERGLGGGGRRFLGAEL